MLQTLSEANLMHHQFAKLFETKPASTASAVPFTLLDSVTSVLKNVFLQMISSLTNPFLRRVFAHSFYPQPFLVFCPKPLDFSYFIPYACIALQKKLNPLLMFNMFFLCGQFKKMLHLSTHHFQKSGEEICGGSLCIWLAL